MIPNLKATNFILSHYACISNNHWEGIHNFYAYFVLVYLQVTCKYIV